MERTDYAMLIKSYERATLPHREGYAPPDIVKSHRVPLKGKPKPESISTSYVERQNPTMPMQMRRLTRLTNAFSKKLENLKAAVALHFAWYNFVRIHGTLRVIPAMEAGIANRVWDMEELAAA